MEQFKSNYDVGDVVLFKKGDNKLKRLIVGVIDSFYIDCDCDGTFWYNVRVNTEEVYTYACKGDIPEWDILYKLEDSVLRDICLYEITQE